MLIWVPVLRYGWFPHLERSGYFLSRTASCFADCLRPEDLKKVSNMDGKTRDDQGNAQKVDNQKGKLFCGLTQNAAVGDTVASDRAAEILVTFLPLLSHTPTNISIFKLGYFIKIH